VLSEEIARLADRVGERAALAPTPRAQGAPVPMVEGLSWTKVPATSGLIFANVLVYVVVAVVLGSTQDLSIIRRAGGNVPALSLAGEPWRLLASTFLHIGILHLALNMYGLWVLGRVVEQIFGPRRFFVVYLLAGLGGALTSAIYAHAGVSAGASGAVMGILGAAVAEFYLRKRAYPELWRREVLSNLLFIIAANVLIASAVPGIDQAAHLGGMITGAVAGATFAPRGGFGKTAVARRLASALAFVGLVLVGGTALAVVTTAPDKTAERLGWTTVTYEGWRVDMPRTWREEVTVAVAGSDAVDERSLIDYGLTAETQAIAKSLEIGPDEVKLNPATAVYGAPGWTGEERTFAFGAGSGRITLRSASYVKRDGIHKPLVLSVTFFERESAAYGRLVRRMLSSARPAE
jgi:membrane associated rhomboid family serine protease